MKIYFKNSQVFSAQWNVKNQNSISLKKYDAKSLLSFSPKSASGFSKLNSFYMLLKSVFLNCVPLHTKMSFTVCNLTFIRRYNIICMCLQSRCFCPHLSSQILMICQRISLKNEPRQSLSEEHIYNSM